MNTAAQVLASFAANLSYSDIPAPVVRRAKDSIIDIIAACAFGAQFPWSRMVIDYALRYGSGGQCSIIGVPDARVHAPYAALANGVLAHAFELDSTRDPSAGAHPGATLLPAVLVTCEERGADGKTAITAFVAGCEVLLRIGKAAIHSKIPTEKLGFHAPGISGPYGAGIAAGRVLGLSAQQLTHTLGIAGSLSAGLLAFTKSTQGGMIKRLHMGRACESGILAARLAAAGYMGPETILEGKFGMLEVYCREGDPALLTQDLGHVWETSRICMKRYACHMAAHTPVQSLRELMAEHKFGGADVEHIIVDGIDKLLSHHNILEPADIMQAQYSVPFCVALALYRDPDDPKSFDASALEDAAIRSACRRVELRVRAGHSTKSACITVELKDGRRFVLDRNSFKGMPDDPLSPAELRRKFTLLTSALDQKAAAQLYSRLDKLEAETRFALN